MSTTYRIVTRTDSGNDAAGWTTDGLGDRNEFANVREACDAIDSLKALGDDWASARYGVREDGFSYTREYGKGQA